VEVQSQLDLLIDAMDERAKALVSLISKKLPDVDSTGFWALPALSNRLKQKSFSDFDLLESWFSDIGTPSPIFQVEPSELNDNWDQMRYHYFTWGYKELATESEFFAPSCWVRIGYSPALTPEAAHLATCLEMILGKGHCVSLLLAHTACNERKEIFVKILTEVMNRELPVKQRIGFNVKTMNKWKLMKHV
jgi:hypothetical protein